MNSIKTFFNSMSQAKQDAFLNLFNDMYTSVSNDKINRLEEFFNTLKSEIDQINRRREHINSMINLVDEIIKECDIYLDSAPSAEVRLFLTTLTKIRETLKEEVDSLKPINKLEKKHDVANKLKMLKYKRDVAEIVFNELRP